MTDNTAIEWTDATWNPLVGCSRVSQGCVNCYAERHAYRFTRQAGTVYEGTATLVNGKPTFTGRVNLNKRALDQPIRWKRPRRIFVNSMSDLFHENVSEETIDRIFAVMSLTPRHTFQVLTKRADRMAELIPKLRERHGARDGSRWPLPNVWLGASVENQEAADERIPLLLRTPAAVRFVSCEPLLGPVNLNRIRDPDFRVTGSALNGAGYRCKIDWVIAGGESGPCARPMHPEWARSLRDQCANTNVPFFFKQWGEWAPGENAGGTLNRRSVETADHFGDRWEFETIRGDSEFDCRDEPDLYRTGKKLAGRTLDGVVHDGFPQ